VNTYYTFYTLPSFKRKKTNFLYRNKEKKSMGQGAYVICEWDSVQKDNSVFQQALKRLDIAAITKCNMDWAPRTFNMARALSPGAREYGRTTIIPALFDNSAGTRLSTWRLTLTSTGNQTLIAGASSGNTIQEDFKIAWAGLAFPNKQQHITELKWQIGDRKYGRINIEEMKSYNKPAIIFEDGYVIDEEEAFDLYAYVESPLPSQSPFITAVYQRVVMLGACYFKVISKLLGTVGGTIP